MTQINCYLEKCIYCKDYTCTRNEITLILLNKDAAMGIKSETLCHEIMHGILVHIGRDDLSHDETFVTALGNAIWQTFDVRCLDEG